MFYLGSKDKMIHREIFEYSKCLDARLDAPTLGKGWARKEIICEKPLLFGIDRVLSYVIH